jgi:formylglycine-generating enzyme
MGDGLLIEFPSVVEAVLCAAEIQQELSALGAEEPPERRIQLRIGINIGDVIRKGNDVFGTGVNIAARLESLAEPGSIYISGEAYDQVRDRPFAFDDLGMRAVKNIARLVRVYRVRPGGASTPYSAAKRRTARWRRALIAASAVALLVVMGSTAMLLFSSPRKATIAEEPPLPSAQTPLVSEEMSIWSRIKTSDRLDELASYLDRFPNGRYSEYIRHRLNALRSHPTIAKFRDCAECPEMIVIPPGSFTMGLPQSEVDRYGVPSGRNLTLHPVRIARPFALGEYLVTRKQYATFAEETGHDAAGCAGLPFDSPLLKYDPRRSWRDPGFNQADDHPVVCVSWDDATAYVNWLGSKTGQKYRLPTEAEWEYAGRAGSNTARYFGDAPLCEFANVRDQAKAQLYSAGQFVPCNGGYSNTSPVGSFPPNGFGLYDMLGNAWEWVEDCWQNSYADAPSDGAAREEAPCRMRVQRGAWWNSTERFQYTLAERVPRPPYFRWENFGIRLARDYPTVSSPSASP